MSGSSHSPEDHCLTIPIENVRCLETHIRNMPFSVGTLKETIVDAGLLQPILVRPAGGGSYDVIDGARRLTALRELGVQELIMGRDVVVDVRETEADVRFKQLIANVQREELSDIELGQAFVTLKEEYGYQYNEIAEILGKTPHFVTAKVGLIKRLDPRVRQLYIDDTEDACVVPGDEGHRRKGIQSTFSAGGRRASEEAVKDDPAISCRSRRPYVMNVNVLEDIARLPREAQHAAYGAIRGQQMDKAMAIEYLRNVKNGQSERALAAQDGKIALTANVNNSHAQYIRKQIGKIERDMECLAASLVYGEAVDPEVVAGIESLIAWLSSLCRRLKAKGAAGPETAATPQECGP